MGDFTIRNRPPLLIALAVLQFLSPLGTILFNALALGVKPGYVLSWILERPPLEIFEALALMPLAGLAILRMRLWSYVVFFLLMSWSLIRNLTRWTDVSHTHSRWMIVAAYALQVGLALYFFLPSVRRVYLDARLRWWESKPRYVLNIPASVDGRPVVLENLSEGGAFIRMDGSVGKLDLQQVGQLSFKILDLAFDVPARAMYLRALDAGWFGYGVSFEHDSVTAKRFARLTSGFRRMGLGVR